MDADRALENTNVKQYGEGKFLPFLPEYVASKSKRAKNLAIFGRPNRFPKRIFVGPDRTKGRDVGEKNKQKQNDKKRIEITDGKHTEETRRTAFAGSF